MDIADRVRAFILEQLLFDSGAEELTRDAPLLEGRIDSFGLLQLVSFLEDEFGIELADNDLRAEHFKTIQDIERLVDSKVANV